MTDFSVSIARGAAAEACLRDEAFLSRWRQLRQRCERASAFQAPAFVGGWFRACAHWHPVVAVAHDSRAALRGLWPLALDPATRALEPAGAWLADPAPGPIARVVDHGHVFRAVWRALLQEPDWQFLRLRGVSPERCIRLLRSAGIEGQAGRQQRTVRVWRPADEPRPLAAGRKVLAVSAVDRVRSVHLSFEVGGPEHLKGALGQLIAWHDLRTGAACGAFPSRELRGLRELVLQEGTEEGRVVWAAIGFDRERPVVGVWGVRDGRTLHGAVPAHAPGGEGAVHDEHMHQLDRWLGVQGVERVEMAGEGHWESVAPGFDEVRLDVEIRRSPRPDGGRVLRRAATRAVARVRDGGCGGSLRWVRRYGLRNAAWRLAARAASLIATSHRLRVYRAGPEIARQHSADARVRCDTIEDLLAFRSGAHWMSRQWFLSTALERLNAGEAVFTISVDGVLAHWGWLVRRQRRAHLSEVHQILALPPGSAVLYDFFTHPDFRGRGLYRSNLQHMLRHALEDPETKQCFICVLDDNAPSRHVIATSGFEYVGTLHWRRYLWSQRTWADRSLENGARPVSDSPPG